MKNEQNIKKGIFSRFLSFLGLQGLFEYLFSGQSKISQTADTQKICETRNIEQQWRDRIGRAEKKIAMIGKKYKEDMETEQEKINKNMYGEENGDSSILPLETDKDGFKRLPKVPRNPSGPIKIGNNSNAIEKSIAQTKSNNKLLEPQRKLTDQHIKALQPIHREISDVQYCIDNFSKCSYDLNKLFLQAVKDNKERVVQLLLTDYKDKIDLGYKDDHPSNGESSSRYKSSKKEGIIEYLKNEYLKNQNLIMINVIFLHTVKNNKHDSALSLWQNFKDKISDDVKNICSEHLKNNAVLLIENKDFKQLYNSVLAENIGPNKIGPIRSPPLPPSSKIRSQNNNHPNNPKPGI